MQLSGHPKSTSFVRTAPCCLSSSLQDFDQLIKSLLGKISNIDFHDNEPTWLQATLHVNYGGLGNRSVVHLASSAFLASADGSANLVKQLLPLHFHNCPQPEFDLALPHWREGLNHMDATLPDSPLQKKWDAPRIQARFDHLLSHTSDPKTRAHLLAVSTKESSAWLNALPVSSLGLCMSNDTVRIAIGLRLGAPLCQPVLSDKYCKQTHSLNINN